MKEQIVLLCYFIVALLLMRLSWTDIRSRIISNKITLLLVGIVVPLSVMRYGEVFFLTALIALLVGFVLFTVRVIGAGDVKLIAALMLCIPSEQIMSFFFFVTFSGLLLIIIGYIFFRQSIRRDGLPYGVAISAGFLLNAILFST